MDVNRLRGRAAHPVARGVLGLAAAFALLGSGLHARQRATPSQEAGPLRRSDLPLSLRYQPFRAPFAVQVDWAGETLIVRRSVAGVPVLPGQSIELSAPDGSPFSARADRGRLSPTQAGWRWTAPDRPGIFGVRVDRGGRWVHLNLFVMHPAETAVREAILGYRIGAYRPRPAGRGPEYDPPRGFVAVRAADRDVLLSPHVTVGEMLCKQPGEPRLVHFTPHLMRKLEAILEEANRQGIEVARLTIMSGFRTPAYNLSIGNRTTLSRHLWGDAADIFIDADGNGVMDDLNGDGRTTLDDANLLARMVDAMMATPPPGVRWGGLSAYRANAAHGPFVHVDSRGQQARW